MYVTQKDLDALDGCIDYVRDALESGAQDDFGFLSDAHKLFTKMRKQKARQNQGALVNEYVRKGRNKDN